jgi:flagellar FliJ protein
MSSLKSLSIAIELATLARDQAMAQWQNTLKAQAHGRDQMLQLQQYASETEQRWSKGAQQGTTSELLHHHYQFMGRLYQAVTLQEATLEAASQRVAIAQRQEVQAEVRLASLQKLLEKRRMEQTRLHQRMEQKHMDEFAAMQTQRRIRQQTEATT